jgi:hypothetical protein
MILFFENGRQVRGDAIQSAFLRSDLVPVPMSLEADLLSDDETNQMLQQGKVITTGSGDVFEIIKREKVSLASVQDERLRSGVRITAMLQKCLPVAFVRKRAIIKEDSTLSGIYRAAGAAISGIDADFPVPRFCCLVGQTPSFAIQQVLHEEGGTVRWRQGKLQFRRLVDLFRQDPVFTLPDFNSIDTQSGFLERHSVPSCFSTASNGTITLGDTSKARVMRYSPFKSTLRLNNMSKALVRRQPFKLAYNQMLNAGDLVSIAGQADMVVITAVHTVENVGRSENQYTRVFLGSLETD